MKYRENIISMSETKNRINAKLNIPVSFFNEIGITNQKRGIEINYLIDKKQIVIKPGMEKVVIFYSNQKAAKVSLNYKKLIKLGYTLNEREAIIKLDKENNQILIKKSNFYLNLLKSIFDKIESDKLIDFFCLNKKSWDQSKQVYRDYYLINNLKDKELLKIINELLSRLIKIAT